MRFDHELFWLNCISLTNIYIFISLYFMLILKYVEESSMPSSGFPSKGHRNLVKGQTFCRGCLKKQTSICLKLFLKEMFKHCSLSLPSNLVKCYWKRLRIDFLLGGVCKIVNILMWEFQTSSRTRLWDQFQLPPVMCLYAPRQGTQAKIFYFSFSFAY